MPLSGSLMRPLFFLLLVDKVNEYTGGGMITHDRKESCKDAGGRRSEQGDRESITTETETERGGKRR